MNPEHYDLLILGSGEGSKFLAWTLAKQGQKVALVERRWIGGSCPNIACLPSKNIIHSAKVANHVSRAKEFGIHIDSYSIDMRGVTDRKRAMVKSLVDIHLANFKNSGAELVLGEAKFIAPLTMQVTLNEGGTRILSGTNVVIGTGTRATLPNIPGLRESQPLTHIEALELDTLPKHLVVMGGGYIGLELSQAFRRFGSQVTIIESNPSLVHNEDPDVIEGIQTLFNDEGIHLVLNAKVTAVKGNSGESIQVTILKDGVEQTIEGTDLLVATGRTPNNHGIGLEQANVALTERGYIAVNERLQSTSTPNVYACGEAAGSPQFTHIALDDFRIIRDHLLNSSDSASPRTTQGRQVPYCMFTDPELAHIGLSESQAKARHIPYRLFKIPMAADLRTRTLSETRGFMKALVAADSDQLLGFTAFSTEAGEIVGAVQIAMLANLPYTTLRDAILTHPTLLEGLVVLFHSTPT